MPQQPPHDLEVLVPFGVLFKYGLHLDGELECLLELIIDGPIGFGEEQGVHSIDGE